MGIQDEDANQDNQSSKTPPAENKTRTPRPPKTPRKTSSRRRSVTPPRQSPSPKEQIGNGHAHPAAVEEVNV